MDFMTILLLICSLIVDFGMLKPGPTLKETFVIPCQYLFLVLAYLVRKEKYLDVCFWVTVT